MAKRGRPKTGARGWKAHRAHIAILAFLDAKQAGAKHEAALDAGAEAGRAAFPGSQMSRSDVRRALAASIPKRGATVLMPNRMSKDHALTLLKEMNSLRPPGSKRVKRISNGVELKWAKRPAIPRSNAKQPGQKSPVRKSQWN